MESNRRGFFRALLGVGAVAATAKIVEKPEPVKTEVTKANACASAQCHGCCCNWHAWSGTAATVQNYRAVWVTSGGVGGVGNISGQVVGGML